MPPQPLDLVLSHIRADLTEAADPETKASEQRFFKDGIASYGVKTPTVNAIAKAHLARMKASHASKADIFGLCDQLWASGYLEEALVACVFSESQHAVTEPGDFALFESWVHHYVSNWATCDTLCNHTVGDLLMRFPEIAERLATWATSDQRWVKRAAAVSLIVPVRRGVFHPLAFRIADTLLTDGDDMVQKGYGWLLKAVSQADQPAVFNYVMKHKDVMPRTALRYAIEKMPPELKQQAMAR